MGAHATQTQPAQARTPARKEAARDAASPRPQVEVSPLYQSVLQRKTCACGGGCPNCEDGPPVIRAKLKVGAHDDEYEREADRVADAVMSVPREHAPAAAHPPAQESAPPVVRAKERPHAPAAGARSLAPELGVAGSGAPLPASAREFFEPRLGFDLGGVRVHADGAAARAAASINARAFTAGRDLFFGAGEYAPDTSEGRRLLAHELTHVIQQGGLSEPRIQRTTHGPTTPTNCHNWTIPLPPWIAGAIAHGQISALLGIPPMAIPRATKLLMGMPSPPAGTPWGFADLWRPEPGAIRMAEIKSTATGGGIAAAEAAHYVIRHAEWNTRAPWTGDVQDMTYAGVVGGPKGAGALDLSGLTGTAGMNLGPFWGDPLKNLFIEADNLGAVVYWCTGPGLVGSPIWYPVFREAMRRLRDALLAAKQAIEAGLETIGEWGEAAYNAVAEWVQGALDWVAEYSQALAFVLAVIFVLLAIAAIIVGAFGEAPSGGTSTTLVMAGAAMLVVSFSNLMNMVGAGSPGLPAATATLAASLQPGAETRGATGGEYERDTGLGNSARPATPAAATTLVNQPMTTFTAALSQLTNPMTLARSLASGRSNPTPAEIAQLQSAVATLEQAGDAASANRVRRMMRATGLTG